MRAEMLGTFGEMSSSLDSVRVEAMVKDFLVERFDIPADRLTSDVFLRDLGLDSIMMLDVMLEVEDRLSIKLSDLSMPPNPTLNDIVTLVERNLATQA